MQLFTNALSTQVQESCSTINIIQQRNFEKAGTTGLHAAATSHGQVVK